MSTDSITDTSLSVKELIWSLPLLVVALVLPVIFEGTWVALTLSSGYTLFLCCLVGFEHFSLSKPALIGAIFVSVLVAWFVPQLIFG